MITREYSTTELLELGNIFKQEMRVCHSLVSEAVTRARKNPCGCCGHRKAVA